jgi:lysozyme family protein
MSTFDHAFSLVIENEGGFGDDPADPGNWTGGAVGAGVCRGTKWGISAATYPTLDISELTKETAQAIYRQRYWNPISADQMMPMLALLVFDAAVNNGVSRAVILLQLAVGSEPDGLLGPETLARVAAADPNVVCPEFQARRLMFMAALSTWHTFGLGWARRLCRLPFQVQAMIGSPPDCEADAQQGRAIGTGTPESH